MDPGSTTEILMHTVRTEYLSGRKRCQYGELYRVNLDTEKISKCLGDKLYFDNNLTSMAISGDVIYVIGGNLLSKKYLRKYVKDKQHLHSRASYFNLVDHDARWKPLPDFRTRYPIVSCAVFKGNLFVFGDNSEKLSHGEELCLTSEPPNGNGWHFLPSPPPPPSETNVIHRHSSNIVSTPVLVDSKNNRILVHYARISSLYAYYPDERKWDFLFSIGWHKLVALFDDKIIFHDIGSFLAYDLQTGTQLDDPFVSPNFPSDLLYREFDALIPLAPPGTFCLAAYSHKFSVPDTTYLTFAKFQAVGSRSGRLRIIFISYYNLHLDCKACVSNYVPIDVLVSSKKDKVVVLSKKDNVVVSSKKDDAVDSSKRDDVGVSSKKGNVVFPSKIGGWESAADVVVSSKKDKVVVSSKEDNVVDSSKRDNVGVSSKKGNVVLSSMIGGCEAAADVVVSSKKDKVVVS